MPAINQSQENQGRRTFLPLGMGKLVPGSPRGIYGLLVADFTEVFSSNAFRLESSLNRLSSQNNGNGSEGTTTETGPDLPPCTDDTARCSYLGVLIRK